MKLVFFSVMYRVLTDYRIQNSRLFPKQYFFFRLKVIKQVINRDLKNTGTKLFSWVQVRLNKIQPKQKIFTHKALVVAYKKNSFFPFSRLYLYFQTFSRSGKLLGKFQDFFKNSRLCTNPVCQQSLSFAWSILVYPRFCMNPVRSQDWLV